MGKEKLAVSIMTAAMRKRTIAQVLWEEAEKDLARGRQMLEEANDAETLPLERG